LGFWSKCGPLNGIQTINSEKVSGFRPRIELI
jgi:hypothetical protein